MPRSALKILGDLLELRGRPRLYHGSRNRSFDMATARPRFPFYVTPALPAALDYASLRSPYGEGFRSGALHRFLPVDERQVYGMLPEEDPRSVVELPSNFAGGWFMHPSDVTDDYPVLIPRLGNIRYDRTWKVPLLPRSLRDELLDEELYDEVLQRVPKNFGRGGLAQCARCNRAA